MHEDHILNTPEVRQINKETFPIGQLVKIEAFIDRESGWEFDAPMHIMSPFHRYHETGSICDWALYRVLEDLLIDVDIYGSVEADDNAWPYTAKELQEDWEQIKAGKSGNRYA